MMTVISLPPMTKGEKPAGPTPRQAVLLDYLHTFHEREGRWPGIREAQRYMRFASPYGIYGYLLALERKGLLPPGAPRAPESAIPFPSRQARQ
jgi:SOS-response transcriptional repressor LexA